MRSLVSRVRSNRARLGRVLAVALILVLAGGVATALSLLPADLASGGAQADSAAAPTGVAVGRLARGVPRRAGRAYYRRITARHVPASVGRGFMALYREASRTFALSWQLIASIHRQETAFSTAPGTYRGLNSFGCCAGPMQFNVTNGPVSTWELYRQSFRLGDRPRRYPHRTRSHPSIYDDFDAIMAAGALLRDGGAGEALDGASWSAAYAYYGHDLFGIEYASQVLGRAAGWVRDGFCLNCPLDETLVAEFDEAYGVDARRQLRAGERRQAERTRKKRARARARKLARERRARARARRMARERNRTERPRSSDRGGRRRAPSTKTETTPAPAPATAPPAAPAPEAPPNTPAPEAPACTPVSRLLGCGR